MDLSYLSDIGIDVVGCESFGGASPSGKSQKPTVSVAQKQTDSVVNGKIPVTRFAPSPTGYLHIGGGRTALFCWLWAKHNKGLFKLRIEDTDEARHDESAVDAIIKGMAWLGVTHDGPIVRQRERCARHQEIGRELLKNGGAFKCYCSKEKLEEMRQEAERNKVPFRYPGTCRSPGFVPPAGVDPVIRIKTPNEGVTSWQDGVMGKIEIPNKDVDDFIILRSEGTPTYLLAVVVDDHDMDVTQVIRGSDHIGNTARQIAIFKNMGWDLPNFAHLPLIHGADGKKLSKRHGATGVEQYEALGYLPEALRNYLCRLSWGHGDDEIFTTEQAIEWFDLSGCSKAAPCFDFDKLNNINMHYIKQCDPDRLTNIFLKLFPDLKAFEKTLKQSKVADMLKPRAKTLVEYRNAAEFIFAKRPISITPASAKNIVGDSVKKVMTDFIAAFKSYTGDWTTDAIEPFVKGFAEEQKMKLGDVAKPARTALTGSVASPGLFEVMWVLGRDEVVGRLQDSVDGKNVLKEETAVATAASVAVKEEAAPAPSFPVKSFAAGIDVAAQIKLVGDEIRLLKEKLKKDGLSGKKIDADEGVKALVGQLTALKAAQVAAVPPSVQLAANVASEDIEAQIKAVGDEIRELKAKLKADGLSGKKIDADEGVKSLVEKLVALKSVPPAPVDPAEAPVAAAAAGATPIVDKEEQIKVVGDEIRALKAKLKADGLSGKKIDANEEVKALVAKLTSLKAL